MASSGQLDAVLEGNGVTVKPRKFARVAALRHTEPRSALSGSWAGVIPGDWPPLFHAVRYATGPDASELLLASGRPTETLAMFDDAGVFDALAAAWQNRTDVCLVDQSCGLWICSLAGSRSTELLARLGATDVIPPPGRARPGRLAEVAVLAVCPAAGELLLLVERVYADHVIAWIRATLADF